MTRADSVLSRHSASSISNIAIEHAIAHGLPFGRGQLGQLFSSGFASGSGSRLHVSGRNWAGCIDHIDPSSHSANSSYEPSTVAGIAAI